MQVNIYTQSKEVFNQFIRLTNDDSWDYIWNDIQSAESVDNDSPFSVFLVSTQFANNIWLMEQVKSLKEQGVHDQSMLFILFNREKVKTQELTIVIEDLQNTLRQKINSPKVIPSSFSANEALLCDDLHYIYFDEEAQEYLTLKQLHANDDFKQNFERFIGRQAIRSILNKWNNTSYLLMKKDAYTKRIVTYNLPLSLIENLEKVPGYTVTDISNEEEFDRVSSDSNIIALKAIENQVKIDKSVLNSNSRYLYIALKPVFKSQERVIYFDESMLKKSILPASHLMNDRELVIVDFKGYPIPKDLITDWKDAIHQGCGLKNIISTVEVLSQ